MPTPPLCLPGSRDALFASHRTMQGSSHLTSLPPYLRGMDLLLDKTYKLTTNADEVPLAAASAVTAILVSPDGDYIMAAQGSSATHYAYRADTGEALPLAPSPVATNSDGAQFCGKTTLRLSPDKQYVYMPTVGTGGNPMAIYKVPEMALVGLANSATAVRGNGCWSPDGTKLAYVMSASPYVVLRNWPAFTGVSINATGAVNTPEDVAFSADSTKLVVACNSASTSGVYTVSTGMRAASVNVPAAQRVELTPDGLYWMFGHFATGTVSFVDPTTLAVVTGLGVPGPGVACNDIRFSTNKKYLLFVYTGYVRVYLWATKELVGDFRPVGGSTLYSADIGPVGRAISNAEALPVRDADGYPIQGVKVRAFSRATLTPRIQAEAVTGEDGKYILPFSNNKPKTLVFMGNTPAEAPVILDWVIPE